MTASFRKVVYGLLLAAASWLSPTARAVAARGELELQVVDQQSGEPMAAQLQLFNAQQRPVWPPGVTRDGPSVVFDGSVVLKLPPGPYSFRLRRGLEYRERTGQFQLQSGDADRQQVDLPRFVNMAEEGWWSGDLAVQPALWPGMPERILAADLHIIPAASWHSGAAPKLPLPLLQSWPARIGPRRAASWLAGCDRRQGIVTWWLNATEPWRIPTGDAELTACLQLAGEFRRSAAGAAPAHLHVARTTHWDLPTWIAHGLVDSVGVLHDGLRETESMLDDADRPLDPVLFPGPEGVGRWTDHVYFQLLEAGVQVPPAAGSGADQAPNRLGYHRTYVQCGATFSTAAWWNGLRDGQCIVTNGPLLRPLVNGQLPGHRFKASRGEKLELEVALQLSTQDKIQYLEIVQNGRPVQQVRLEDWAAGGGRLPPVVFETSGWLLIRAVADDPRAYRAAMTGPYYVIFDEQPRVSRQAAQFFVDWVYARARQFKLPEAAAQRAALAPHRVARDFWQQRVTAATAD